MEWWISTLIGKTDYLPLLETIFMYLQYKSSSLFERSEEEIDETALDAYTGGEHWCSFL